MFDKLLAKAIPPRLALDTMTANAVETFKHPISAYKADLFMIELKVDILVTHAPTFNYPPKYQNETHQHKYWITEGPELCKMIKFKAEEMAESKGEIQHITIEYQGKDAPYIVTMYVKEGEEKIKIVKEIK